MFKLYRVTITSGRFTGKTARFYTETAALIWARMYSIGQPVWSFEISFLGFSVARAALLA